MAAENFLEDFVRSLWLSNVLGKDLGEDFGDLIQRALLKLRT
jgi:hypothetical protein